VNQSLKMSLKDAINLANKRDGVPPLRFNYKYSSGCATPVHVRDRNGRFINHKFPRGFFL
jgi:hypothetical protein